MNPRDFARARTVLETGLAARAFPAAVVDVGTSAESSWREAFGRLTYDNDASACTLDTIFDVASLTKVMVAVPVAMALVEAGRLDLEAPVARFIHDWHGRDRSQVTIRQLLEHSAGLPPVHDAWRGGTDRRTIVRELAQLPLAYVPGTRSVYSDPGFILLGVALEQLGEHGLDEEFASLRWTDGLDTAIFNPGPGLLPRIAPTAWCEWRQRVAHGEVHDSNAAALGGVAAHAGLFATAGAVAAYARLVLRTFVEPTPLGTPAMMQRFAARSNVPGSSRALGWDTALPTSSCGTHMSGRAIGHTGFTGTSLWIDPEQDFYAVLLTNRVYPDAKNDALVALRPRLHDALLG